jgi:cAMP-dependent protein kinase regulator/CRP/FNR family cyclic AMP-dependent transcriptional regulator/cGMP-dependent protein kinase 2
VRRTLRSVRRDDYLEFLSTLGPFTACSPTELRTIARASTLVARESGNVLVRRGASVREFFVLASGSAVIIRDGLPDVAMRPGDWFGDVDLLSKSAASATVIALTDVELVVMSYPEFSALFDGVRSFRRRLVRALATSSARRPA